MQVEVNILEKQETKKLDYYHLISQFEIKKYAEIFIMTFKMVHLLKRK